MIYKFRACTHWWRNISGMRLCSWNMELITGFSVINEWNIGSCDSAAQKQVYSWLHTICQHIHSESNVLKTWTFSQVFPGPLDLESLTVNIFLLSMTLSRSDRVWLTTVSREKECPRQSGSPKTEDNCKHPRLCPVGRTVALLALIIGAKAGDPGQVPLTASKHTFCCFYEKLWVLLS